MIQIIKENTKKLILLNVIILIMLTVISCEEKPIKIGFVGSLTSKQSQLSIDARNAITVGINQVNAKGGIHGRPLVLIVKDDEGNYETSLQKYEEFKAEGVKFIIGPMTSNLADAVLEGQGSELLFISPSMSTNQLDAIDDNFLRVSPLIDAQSEIFLKYIDSKNYEHLTIIYDLSNREYTEYLSNLIKKDGQSIINTIEEMPFNSQQGDLKKVLSDLNVNKTDGVLMISQATDTAFIAQRINQENLGPDLYSVSWSMTQDLVRFGGKTIEGMHLIGIYKSEEPSKEHLVFGNAFYEKFSYEASFVSILAYDAFNVLAEGMKSADELTVNKVKEAILSIKNFSGLEDSIQMDQYGDSKRNYLMYEVINGRFVPEY